MSDFYNRAYNACKPYFGRETKEFLDKQIQLHLLKNSESLDSSDKAELSRWIWASSALVIGKENARDLADRILSI